MMETYILLMDSKVVDIFESEIEPQFTSSFTLLDGSKFDMSTVKHGYIYEESTNSFREPLESEIPQLPVEEVEERTPTEMELTQAQILLNTELLLIYKELETEMI